MFKAIVVLSGFILFAAGVFGPLKAAFDDWRFDPGTALQITYRPIANGQVFSRPVTMVVPYGTRLPTAADSGYYCGDAPKLLVGEGGTYLGAFARVVLQNKGDANFGSIQISALRTDVVQERKPGDGVLIGCLNSGGDVPIVATTEAVDGHWATMEFETTGETVPVGFVLDPGEQQVVDLIINPSNYDVEMNVVVDYVHDNKEYSINLTDKEIRVPSGAGAWPYLFSPGSPEQGWTCSSVLTDAQVAFCGDATSRLSRAPTRAEIKEMGQVPPPDPDFDRYRITDDYS